MRGFICSCCLCLSLCTPSLHATIFGQVRGIVHDPQHRPIPGAQVEVNAVHSSFRRSAVTGQDGSFLLLSVPLGQYTVTVSHTGFAAAAQPLLLASDTSPLLHFELQLGTVQQTVTVETSPQSANVDTVTPTALVSRDDIAQTPGAGLANSMTMITDFVPGAYISHDMLHIRGGHQVSWLIDGVQIPNTNISANLGAQINPRDIDYLEIQRGSYTSDIGNRTFGVFNVVPRTGFERSREAEIILTAGNFHQTDDQLNFGDHTTKFAYYASLNGNRSDYGLAPPVAQALHDAANGYGSFVSLIWNPTPEDQLRSVSQSRNDYFQIPFDPDPRSFENQQFNSSGLRDGQHEADLLTTFSWLHTFNASTVLQLSPFFHRNRADYESRPTDTPVATTSDRASIYSGAQASITTEIKRNTLQAGAFGFAQSDHNRFGAIFNDASGTPAFSTPASSSGGVVEEYLSDNFKATSWLTLIGGLRATHFRGQFNETQADPRLGVAVRVPALQWVFRAFYGRFYQPPPLLTASGPIVQLASASNISFQPLHGENDEEHQFGVQMPWRGWLLDAGTSRTRIRNFLDHSTIGNSGIFYPVTVAGALVRAWELTLRSPGWKLGQAHLAYSNQIAQQRGNLTGGLVCTPIGDPACDQGFAYTPVDHDQRNTLSAGFHANLPFRTFVSTTVSYGSGMHNGNPDPATPFPNEYLPFNTTVDLSIGKRFGDRLAASVTATNLANRRVLLDNSLTFGGFHYNNPRQVYAELRYRFKY